MQDRGERRDDKEEHILDNRIKEFNEKTAPVIETYQKSGLIAPVKATGSREDVFTNTIDALMHFALTDNHDASSSNSNNLVKDGEESIKLHGGAS